DLRSLPLRDLVIGGILLLVVGNLVYLDIKTAARMITPPVLPSVTQTPITQNNTNVTITPVASITPPCASCPAQINTAMSLIQNIQAALSITPRPTLSPTITPVSSSSGLLVKEYFIPMGLGYGQSADWTDVPGVK